MNGEPCVLWLVPKAWEDEGRLVAQHAPLPLGSWLQTLRDEGLGVTYLSEGQIIGGPWHGGQVVAVEGELAYHLFAVPAEALPLLHDAVRAINDHARRRPVWPAGPITARC